ncbi:MAG: Ppx/GppA family phosphatase [Chromatiales bacterium]|nr:Ppx/GppA family phosphatase [Chromatiales bacterium]
MGARATSGPARSGEPEILAAVDLGSNSFHMLVARFSHGQLGVVDRLREMVRLGAGLDERGRLDAASQQRALACLARFGERLRAMRAERVRVVATNTLRKARASSSFLRQAEAALGHPVEIISGIEEARLVYLGASHHLPGVHGPRSVIDIGGGSTEIIVGQGFEPMLMESLSMGCVSMSARHFSRGRLLARHFEQARLAVRLELEPVRAQFDRIQPEQVAGTSGTIRAAYAALSGLDRARRGITVTGLEHLIGLMMSAGSIDQLSLPGISPERAEVLPGGLAILVEVMKALDMDRMRVANGALREGILYDMIGRLTDEDARERTVRAMAARYHVDAAQARRVEATALQLLAQVRDSWDLSAEEAARLLGWAARLHEVGLDIAHAHYHRHGAYLLEHADMAGFAREEQRVLSAIVLAHRRKFEKNHFQKLPRAWGRRAMRLGLILRLAVLFNRSRTTVSLPPISLQARGRTIRLGIPGGWLDASPLTLADLDREREYLSAAGIGLEFTRLPGPDASA